MFANWIIASIFVVTNVGKRCYRVRLFRVCANPVEVIVAFSGEDLKGIL